MTAFNLLQTQLVEPNATAWKDYTHHAFVEELAKGVLPVSCFQHYLQQDYLFLKHYARAYALAIYKSDNIADMEPSFTCLQGLLGGELTLHLSYCQEWGLDAQAIEALEEGVATVAYTRFVIDTGVAGDLLDLLVALAPCALGYAEIGKRLYNATSSVSKGNPYWPWVEMYASDDFVASVNNQLSFLEKKLNEIPLDSPRWAKLQRIFCTATKMESAFWLQGLVVNES